MFMFVFYCKDAKRMIVYPSGLSYSSKLDTFSGLKPFGHFNLAKHSWIFLPSHTGVRRGKMPTKYRKTYEEHIVWSAVLFMKFYDDLNLYQEDKKERIYSKLENWDYLDKNASSVNRESPKTNDSSALFSWAMPLGKKAASEKSRMVLSSHAFAFSFGMVDCRDNCCHKSSNKILILS